jgi:haloacid dehalogenase superfamily, subfamily IA, variant 3 with third motif having DD or ED/haloacid dehalogenase superfamily, subfamily IA, variant 1 with third motif having Dx(3-4)D or Dx(3-4)E
MKPRLIVFDWDGTLADSTAVIKRAIKRSAVDLGYPEPSDERASYIIGMGLQAALQHAIPMLKPSDLPSLLKCYRQHFLAGEDEIALFEGVLPMLDRLQTLGFWLAIATGKSRLGLDRALDRMGLRSRFLATRCADEGFAKPHPGMLYAVYERTGVAPHEAVMVGDTTHDLQLAQNAGSPAVGVTYGAHDAEWLLTYPALALVDSVAALQQTLESLELP